MTTDCSLNYDFSTWKIQAQNMLCTQIGFLFWHSEQFMYTACSELRIFMYWTRTSTNNILSYYGNSWCKNKYFWKLFACNRFKKAVRGTAFLILPRFSTQNYTNACIPPVCTNKMMWWWNLYNMYKNLWKILRRQKSCLFRLFLNSWYSRH